MAENQPEADTQVPAPPPQPDLMGYKSTDDLVAAKRASDREAQRMAQRIQELEQERVNPAARMQERDPYRQLNEWGLPVDDLRAAINQGVAEALQPLTRSVEARNSILQRKPDFLKHEPQVMQWLAENPDLSRRYQRGLQNDPELAYEWAYNEYTISKRSDAPAPVSLAEDPAAMAIPNGQASNSRSADPGVDAEAMKKAIAYGQQYGDWNPFMKLRSQGTSIDFNKRGDFIDKG